MLFAIILVLSTFAACSFLNDTEETQGGGSQGEVTTEAVETPPVPDKDWGGRTFNVLAVRESFEPNFEIVGDLKGDNVSSAVYVRNDWIQQKYNVDIQEYGD